MTVLILGFGISGRASAALLRSHGFSVVAADRRWEELRKDPQMDLVSDCKNPRSYLTHLYPDELRARAQQHDASCCRAPHFARQANLGANMCADFCNQTLEIVSDDLQISLDRFSFCVVSPGIDPAHPLLRALQERGIETIGEIELAFRYLPNLRILGVTGSNGKTTTVLLIAHILNAAKKKARALGNIGAALSAYAIKPDLEEILIIELSSFQLESLRLQPRFDAAAILNITPNHLNRHASMEEYAAAKLRIGSCLKPNGKIFISEQVARQFLVKGEIFDREEEPPINLNQVRLGIPEWENIAAAKALTSFCGVGDDEFFSALETFRKPAHRIEWVAEIGGVAYYNDSKASNVEAVMHAMRLFNGPILLIAGGMDKGSSYRPWISSFQGKVKHIAVFGEAALKMEMQLASDFPVMRRKTLQEALDATRREAKSGDTVLFSPGCSSYDQFMNFEQRGETFKKLVLCHDEE